MSPDAPYCLPQVVRPIVMVIRVKNLMLVKDDHHSLFRILRIMQILVMTGIPGHDRYIIDIRGIDGKILRIQALQAFIIKHLQPLSRQTAHPEPVLQRKQECNTEVRAKSSNTSVNRLPQAREFKNKLPQGFNTQFIDFHHTAF